MCDVVYDVLQNLHLVGLLHQGVELDADFTLPGRGYLVMVYFRFQPELFQGKTHRGTQIVQRVHRRHREVTAFDGWAVACVAFLEAAVGIPGAFLGIDLVKRALHRVVPRHVIEDEKLVLRPEECGVGNAR